MSNQTTIGTMCHVYDGPHATPTKTEQGPVYLGIDAITDDGHINQAEYNHLSESDYKIWTKRVTPQYGDLVFSYEATLGRYALIPEGFHGCLGRRLAVVRPKDNRISIRWLYYYFLSPEWKVFIANHTVKGSTVNRISVDDFPQYPIPLLERSEQDRLVSVLCTIDERIALNKRVNAELEVMSKTIYDYWFVQFDFPDENGKPYRTFGGKMEWNEQLKRKIPKGWDVLKLEKCISKVSTGLNPRDNFKLGNGTIKYITVKNLCTDGSIDFTNCNTVDTDAQKRIHERSDISIGDILFASIAPLGRCYLIQDTPTNWNINESVFSIRPDYGSVMSEYLYMYFLSDSFITRASSSSTGSIFKGIRIGTLLDMPIIVPPKPVIDAFSECVGKLLYLKYEKNLESEELTNLRDWLLPMLMNGQATVSSETTTNTDSHVVEMPKTDDERFSLWLQNQGIAARGDLDKKTLREIFDAMDDDDK